MIPVVHNSVTVAVLNIYLNRPILSAVAMEVFAVGYQEIRFKLFHSYSQVIHITIHHTQLMSSLNITTTPWHKEAYVTFATKRRLPADSRCSSSAASEKRFLTCRQHNTSLF
jgi:hypothetical protein